MLNNGNRILRVYIIFIYSYHNKLGTEGTGRGDATTKCEDIHFNKLLLLFDNIIKMCCIFFISCVQLILMIIHMERISYN